MLSSRIYLKMLFLILGIILTTAILYAGYFFKHYPLPVTGRISFDAKIKFIHEHINTDEIDTIIVGSSIGLNNVQGAYLEKGSKKCKKVLNFSVYESSAIQVEQLLSLTGIFPNLKRIIYSAQFPDFQHTSKFKNYDPEFLVKYIRKDLNPILYAKAMFRFSKDLIFLLNRHAIWNKKHMDSNSFYYLGFDHTGSVPLKIYEQDAKTKDFNKRRWYNPHSSRHVQAAFDALDRMSKKAYKNDIKFYFVHQPYREELIKKYPHVLIEMNRFLELTKEIVIQNNGFFLSLYKELQLGNKYFADRSHLNDKGSILAAEAVGEFIDGVENKKF